MTEDQQKQIAAKEDQELAEFADEMKDDLSTKQPAQSEEKKLKTIEIDWPEIPYIFSLREKMKKALELDLEHVSGSPTFVVKNGAEPHNVTENSCDCEDWKRNGTSLGPCKHILRVKYSVDDLTKMIEEPDTNQRKDIKKGGGKMKKVEEKKEIVQKRVQKQEIALIESEQDDLLMIPDIAPALAEMGKIKVGGHSDKTTKSGYRLPEKWDCFKIGSMLKDENGDVIIDKELTNLIGENCKELDIYLAYDTPVLNIPNFYASFSASKLQCRGNGRKGYRRDDSGELQEIVCNRKECPLNQQKKCKPYAKLSVILEKVNRVGGVYVLRTTSYNSIRNLISSMAFISNITGGILAGISLKLRLMPVTVIPNGLNKKVTIYVTNLEFAGTLAELKKAALEEIERRLQLGFDMRKLEESQRKQIAKQATEEVEEDAEAIENEFYVEGNEE